MRSTSMRSNSDSSDAALSSVRASADGRRADFLPGSFGFFAARRGAFGVFASGAADFFGFGRRLKNDFVFSSAFSVSRFVLPKNASSF